MKIARPIALLVALLLLTGCTTGAESAKTQRQIYAMDTVMLLTAYGAEADTALDAAEARIIELEADLDPERDGSSVRAVNEHAGEWVSVSPDCLSVAQTANEIAVQSGGALAPQLYDLVRMWGFVGGEYRVPTQQEIDTALAAIDGFCMEVDSANCALRIPVGTSIGFGAVAKGYAAEAALDAMEAAGCTTAILSLGGNVQTLGERKPDGSRWSVAVMDPNDNGAYVATLSVGECAVVTSGDYQRYFERDGVRYSHILDPKTGYPAENGLRSVTVVCDNGARADALSTAMFVLGEQGALDNWRQNGGFELVLVTAGGRVVATDGLRGTLTEDSSEYTYEYVK